MAGAGRSAEKTCGSAESRVGPASECERRPTNGSPSHGGPSRLSCRLSHPTGKLIPQFLVNSHIESCTISSAWGRLFSNVLPQIRQLLFERSLIQTSTTNSSETRRKCGETGRFGTGKWNSGITTTRDVANLPVLFVVRNTRTACRDSNGAESPSGD